MANVTNETAAPSELAKRRCGPCREGAPPIRGKELQDMLSQLQGWSAVDERQLTKTYGFPDFARALEFVNRVGKLADEQDHHPDVHLSWGKVRIDLWTHKVGGLSDNDFIFAAKVDELPRS